MLSKEMTGKPLLDGSEAQPGQRLSPEAALPFPMETGQRAHHPAEDRAQPIAQ